MAYLTMPSPLEPQNKTCKGLNNEVPGTYTTMWKPDTRQLEKLMWAQVYKTVSIPHLSNSILIFSIYYYGRIVSSYLSITTTESKWIQNRLKLFASVKGWRKKTRKSNTFIQHFLFFLSTKYLQTNKELHHMMNS